MHNLSQSDGIPKFPEFKSIKIDDKRHFDLISEKYPGFSDFNFNSFFSWDLENKHAISELNGNLVLKFSDYETSEPFLTFIGERDTEKTVEQIFALAQKMKMRPMLKLVPEPTAKTLDPEKFIIEEDPNNFDYIFSFQELSELKGNRFKTKRRMAQKCIERKHIMILDSTAVPNSYDLVLSVMYKWRRLKLLQQKDTNLENEELALTKMLHNVDKNNLKITLAFDKDEPVGFSIDELLPDGYVLSHHAKTIPNDYGLAEYFNQQLALWFKDNGYKYWNWEQDLGVEVLQRMKNSYRPIFKQKKYTIKAKKQS